MQNYNFFTNMNIYFPEKTEKIRFLGASCGNY